MSELERVPFVLPPVPHDFLVSARGLVTETMMPISPAEWLDGEIKHFSPTSLRMLKLCPEQYRQRYVLHRKEAPAGFLTLGTATHDAMAFNWRHKLEKEEDKPTTEVVEYFHDKSWPDSIEKDGGASEIRWGDEKQDDLRRDGERMTQAYHATVAPRIIPVAPPEQEIILWIEGVPVPLKGYLDVEEEGNVNDLKTSKSVTRKPDGHWRMQGMIYSLAKEKPTHFHSLSRAKTPSIATPLTDPEMALPWREDLAETTREILRDYAAQVEFFYNRYGPDQPWPTSGVFMDLKGGPACRYCGFRKFCPAWAWERNPIPVPTDMTNLDGTPIMFPGAS